MQYVCPTSAYCYLSSNTNHDTFFYSCVCVCPDLYVNFNLGALVFQECCHTRQKWNLWVCGFCVSVLCMCVCVCISKHVPISVCLFIPTFVQTALLLHLWRLPLFSFSNSLSFSPFVAFMFTSVRLHIRTLFLSHWGQKSCAHTFMYTQWQVGTYSAQFAHVPSFAPLSKRQPLHGKARVSTFTDNDRFTVSRFDYESNFTFAPGVMLLRGVYREKHELSTGPDQCEIEDSGNQTVLSATVFHTSRRSKEKISSLRN